MGYKYSSFETKSTCIKLLHVSMVWCDPCISEIDLNKELDDVLSSSSDGQFIRHWNNPSMNGNILF